MSCPNPFKRVWVLFFVIAGLLLIVLQLKENYWANNGYTKESSESHIAKKDRIDLAMRQEFDKTHDPALNYIPVVRMAAAERARRLKVAERSKSKALSMEWDERGPNNVGGRTRALMWDPNDLNETKVWAGSVTGGLWYNNDITSIVSEWQSVDDTWNNIAISAIAYDPNDTDIFYVGTGEGHTVGSSRGAGIYKSIDGGSNWTQMTTGNGFYDTESNFHYVNDIVVRDESGSSVVYVATQGSFSDYDYFEYSLSGQRGLWRSTDGGVNFSQVLPNVPAQSYNYSAADIELSASGRLFVGTTIDYVNNGGSLSFRSGGGTVLWSDDGTSWSVAFSDTGDRVEIACAPSNADVAYAVAANGNNVGWIRSTTVADQVSPTTWTNLSIPSYTAQNCTLDADDFSRGQAWYDLILAVDPDVATTVFIGGIDLYKSTNSGSSFDLISYWTGNCDTYVHADQHSILFNPENSNEAVIGNDGGVYYSSDLGSATDPDFEARNNGYNVTQFYGTAIHPTASTDHFLAGSQDNGSQRFTSSGINATTEVSGGDGAYCNIDQDEPTYQWTQYVYNTFYRSTNGGTSFGSQMTIGSGQTGRFINPSRYDDTQNIMYAAAAAGNYNRWSNPQSGTTSAYVSVSAMSGEEVSAVTVSPNTTNRIFLGTGADIGGGTPGGHVYRVDDAHTGTSKTGVDISDSNFPTNAYVSSISVEHGDDDHILVCFSNFGVSSIWETTNGGTSWTEVEGDLPDMPVRWVEFHPDDATRAFAATELGVWSTDELNGASTVWETHTADGFPNIRTDMLQFRTSDNLMIAATHGRGLFSADITLPVSSDPEIMFANSGQTLTESSSSGSGCRTYTDYTITMLIAIAPTGNAEVTVASNALNTTANDPADYEITTAMPIVFSSGSAANQSFNLRVYDDEDVESTETIELEYTIGGASNAVNGSTRQTHTLVLNDNDETPEAVSTTVLLEENWDGTITGWLQDAGNSTNTNFWLLTSSCSQAIDNVTAQIVNNTSGDLYCGYWNFTTSTEIYKEVDASGYSDLEISFDYICGGDAGNDFGSLVYSFDNGANWTDIATYQGDVSVTSVTDLALPDVLDDDTFMIGWRWTSDNTGVSDPSFSVDNIVLTGSVPSDAIESSLSSSSDEYLGPNSTVSFFDESTGDMIAIIENTSNHDYGCTSVTIDRVGTSAQEFWDSGTDTYLMDKTIMVTPTSNNLNGSYTMTLFFTQAEIDGWTAVTSKTTNDLTLAKTSLPVSSVNSSFGGGPSAELGANGTIVAFGTGYALSADFTTGFSGIGGGDPGDPPGGLPIELLSFNVRIMGPNAELSWISATERNTHYIDVQHSSDGNSYKRIGTVDAAGESNELVYYDFTHYQIQYGEHYYRLKMVDMDGTFEYSEVRFLVHSGNHLTNVYPNPVNDNFTIECFATGSDESLKFSLLNLSGRQLLGGQLVLAGGQNKIEVDAKELREGTYVLRLENSTGISHKKLVVAR